MIVDSSLSSESIHLLKLRGQSDQEVSHFADLLSDANEKIRQDISAKEILSDMNPNELALIQASAGLVDPISVDALSNEGAINLLAQPDKKGMVDLNNDGLVEVGIAKSIVFPPVNAPESVRVAWEEATQGMSEKDKMVLQLHMHTTVYGVHIDGIPTKQPLSPEAQWGKNGIEQLFEQLRSALDFSVAMDGWNRYNLLKQGFFDQFEQALGNSVSQAGAESELSNGGRSEELFAAI